MTQITRVYQDRILDGHRVIIKNSRGDIKIAEVFEGSQLGYNQCAHAVQEWSKFLGLLDREIIYKTFEQLHSEYRVVSTKEFNWNKMLHREWGIWNKKYKNKQEMMTWLMPHYMEGPPSPVWLSENANGSWVPAKGGYRFELERDAVLYKMFCSN